MRLIVFIPLFFFQNIEQFSGGKKNPPYQVIVKDTHPCRCGISCPIVISCATFWYRSWLLSTIDSRMASDRCKIEMSEANLFT